MIRYVLMLIAVSIGIAAIIFGEADDSPGLQGIGLIAVVTALVFAWRTRSRS